MPESETWTIGKLLKWTEDYLSKVGSDTARLDAEVLLAHAKRCQRIELYTAFDEIASEELRGQFRELVKRRAAGTPVAYLVERREFYSLPFRVSPAVLIPRPETELLVVRLLDRAKEMPKPAGEPLTILDIGTGSGVIAICAALYLPTARVLAVDVSQDALEVARANAARHKVLDRIDFRHTDLLEGITEKVHVIASNLPYVSEAEFEELDSTVRHHEPRLALVGGPQGTELIERLIQQSRDTLLPGGWLILEISPMIVDAVRHTIESTQWLSQFRVTQDLAKHPRIVEAQRTTNA